jgi:hypothetical protein
MKTHLMADRRSFKPGFSPPSPPRATPLGKDFYARDSQRSDPYTVRKIKQKKCHRLKLYRPRLRNLRRNVQREIPAAPPAHQGTPASMAGSRAE